MQLKQIDLYLLRIQLRMPVKHNLANHSFTENLVVKVTTGDGVAGYGEGVPRQYVTGETSKDSLRSLHDFLIPRAKIFRAAAPTDLERALAGLTAVGSRVKTPAACCALELAILDAAGKSWGQSVADMLGGSNRPLTYSAVIPITTRSRFLRLLYLIRDLEMHFVKIKVGSDKDLERLALARQILGDEVDLRVDANGAWRAMEAENRIAAMRSYGISAVEQPVAKHDIQGMKRVAEGAAVPVIADESLCTEYDAKQLASLTACQVFNLRLSKCGGMFAAKRVHEIGRKKGIVAQLGCQIGETGILASAGHQLAASLKLLYLEGCYSNYLLKEDVVNEPLQIGTGGVVQPLREFGLGMSVNEKALKRLAVMHQMIKLQ